MDITHPSVTPNPEGDLAFIENALRKAKDIEVTKKLATFVEKVWQTNQADNKQTRLEMIMQLRRTRGEYEPQKLMAIRAFQGSEVFIRSSENKCRSAESWIKDIYRGDTDIPWAIEPTAVPDLPNETLADIRANVHRRGMELSMQLASSGQIADPKQIADMMNEWQDAELDKARKELEKDSKKKCDRAALLIRDKNQEGGWNDAFKNFLWYFVRTKAGIIKGPILTKKPKSVWVADVETGGFKIDTIETLVNDVYCVSPFNFYPSRGMSNISDGNVIELHELTKSALSKLIGVPGYSESEIRIVLDKYAKGDLKAKWFTVDDETLVKQVEKEKNLLSTTTPTTSNTLSSLNEDTIFAQEFYGTVPGNLLIEWGIEGELDPNIQYQANCWKIGDHVIKAVVNPDSLGRKPYHISSWAKNPAWVWGEGLTEVSAPIEDILNSIARALQNNIAIASGPQVEINIDRCDDKSPMYPWKRWFSTGAQMKEAPAIAFYQPQMHSGELIQAWQLFSKVLDEMTVPAYAQGASQSGVTAGTATVFTQLLAAASRSIKAVAANIDDDVITPYIQMCYDYEMKFGDDPSTKGDARVVAKGVAGLLAKEQASQRKNEFLQLCANPLFSQILGEKNIGSMLSQVAKSQDITLPDMARLDGSEDISAIIQQMLLASAGVQPQESKSGGTPGGEPTSGQQMSGNIGMGGTPTNPQALLGDGSPAGVNYAA